MPPNPRTPVLALAFAATLAAGCTAPEKNTAAREWQKAECNRIIDQEDRDRCLRRVERTYGGSARDTRPEPAQRR